MHLKMTSANWWPFCSGLSVMIPVRNLYWWNKVTCLGLMLKKKFGVLFFFLHNIYNFRCVIIHARACSILNKSLITYFHSFFVIESGVNVAEPVFCIDTCMVHINQMWWTFRSEIGPHENWETSMKYDSLVLERRITNDNRWPHQGSAHLTHQTLSCWIFLKKNNNKKTTI